MPESPLFLLIPSVLMIIATLSIPVYYALTAPRCESKGDLSIRLLTCLGIMGWMLMLTALVMWVTLTVTVWGH